MATTTQGILSSIAKAEEEGKSIMYGSTSPGKDEDDCGRSDLLDSVEKRMEAIFGTQDPEAIIKAVAESAARGNTGLVGAGFGLGGGSSYQGQRTAISNFAAAFTCISLRVENRCTQEVRLEQTMNFDCGSQFDAWLASSGTCLLDTVREGIDSNIAAQYCVQAYEIGADALTKVCSAEDVSQTMNIEVEGRCELSSEVANQIINEISSTMQQNVSITDDFLDNIVAELGDVASTALRGKTVEIQEALAEAMQVSVNNIDTEFLNEFFQKVEAVQRINATAYSIRGVHQDLATSVAMEMISNNANMNEAFNKLSNEMEQWYEEYVKSLDDYIESVGSVLTGALLWLGLGAVGLFLFIFLIRQLSSGGSKAAAPPPPQTGYPMMQGPPVMYPQGGYGPPAPGPGM